MNRIDKLIDMLQTAPNDCFLKHALGLEYIKLEQYSEAIQSFEGLLQIDKNYVGTYYHLAKTFEKISDNQKAIAIYESGIALAKQINDKHAQNELQMALDDLIDQ
jgi:Tfp pilus assembly protein PilF